MFLSLLLQLTSSNLAAHIIFQTSLSLIIYRDEPISLFGFLIHRIKSFFYVERPSEEGSPVRKKTPAVLNSKQLSGAMARETITIASAASLESQIVTIDSDSNESTIAYGFGNKHPIVSPRLNDLNLPPDPFIVLATMAVIRADEEYSPQSTEPSIPSPNSTPPMNVSTIENWKTMHTTTDNATFFSQDEPKRVYWDISSRETFDSNEPRHVSIASRPSSTPPPQRQHRTKLSMENPFPKKGECRSTPARHAASPHWPKKESNAQKNSNITHF